jgi:RNA polymerase sigma factor (sigma-70 family)
MSAWIHKPITAEQESELITKAKEGCSDSMNRLFEGHFPWWVKQCSEFLKRRFLNSAIGNEYRGNYEMDELLSMCFMGMQKAVLKFDQSLGNRLLTFCGYNCWRWFHSRERVEFRPMIMVDDDYLKTSAAIADPSVDLIRKFEAEQYKWIVNQAVEVMLHGREKMIIQQRYLTDHPQTLKQIGDQLGISKERVRQIEKESMWSLMRYFEKYYPWLSGEIRGEDL